MVGMVCISGWTKAPVVYRRGDITACSGLRYFTARMRAVSGLADVCRAKGNGAAASYRHGHSAARWPRKYFSRSMMESMLAANSSFLAPEA
jgi:hypothetical protein